MNKHPLPFLVAAAAISASPAALADAVIDWNVTGHDQHDRRPSVPQPRDVDRPHRRARRARFDRFALRHLPRGAACARRCLGRQYARDISRFFGTDELPYTQTAAGVTRTFATLTEAGDNAVDARVFGGMHFRTGCVHGLRHGEQGGRFVIQHELRPVRGRSPR